MEPTKASCHAAALHCTSPSDVTSPVCFLVMDPVIRVMLVCLIQTENEAAMQQIKRLRLEHAHSLQHLTEENARLQRTLAHIQVHHQIHCATLCSFGFCNMRSTIACRVLAAKQNCLGDVEIPAESLSFILLIPMVTCAKVGQALRAVALHGFTNAATIDLTRMTYLPCTPIIASKRIPYNLCRHASNVQSVFSSCFGTGA